MDAKRPVFVVLGGPNGAGKSTTARRVAIGDFINPDVIAKRMNPLDPESVGLAAAREALKALKSYKEERRSFTYETTLSSQDSIRQIEDAKSKGYEVRLYFVALESADQSIERVTIRVRQGGHDIPEEALRRRFQLTLDNALIAAQKVDRFELIDNHGFQSETILVIEHQNITFRAPSTAPIIQRLADALVAAVQRPLNTSPPTSPWWHPERHADRRAFLHGRARIKADLRAHFAAEGFIEVETGCLQVSPGNEAHLHAFATELIGTDLTRRPLYLHTSPEFAMKKLLAAGESRIVTFAPVFRNREQGPTHTSEFTMLEWYRAGADYSAMMDDCGAILRIAALAARARWVSFRGTTCDPHAQPHRLTVAEAFTRHAGIDLFATIGADGLGDREHLSAAALDQGIRVDADYTWADLFARILTERIEPNLGVGRPTVLCDYPTFTSALARPSARDPRVAERFELYVCGVELANGFSELTDAAAQRANLMAEMDLKQDRYGERYPLDEDFLAALAHMPPSAGCALGFDRLVMLATGAERLDQVIWTPLTPG